MTLKTYFIVLCLLASGGWATATITLNKFSPDKGDRLYVDSDVQKMDFTEHSFFSAWWSKRQLSRPTGMKTGLPTIMRNNGWMGRVAVVFQRICIFTWILPRECIQYESLHRTDELAGDKLGEYSAEMAPGY